MRNKRFHDVKFTLVCPRCSNDDEEVMEIIEEDGHHVHVKCLKCGHSFEA
ncbi:MAG: hypothetical protein ACYCX4_17815 [Bacillota bacterium]